MRVAKRRRRTLNQRNEKIEIFYPMVGSLSQYETNVKDVLSAVQTNAFSRAEAARWMMERYGASREFSRHVLQMLRRVGILTLKEKKYQLTPIGMQYLKTGERDLLAHAFINNVAVFRELIEILAKAAPVEMDNLFAMWKEKTGTGLRINQFRHRLDWLRGLDYASMVARKYFPTAHGLRLATEIRQETAETDAQQRDITHQDLEEKLTIIGEFFQFETTKRPSINDVLPSYALKLAEGDRQLDCVWVRFVHFAGKMRFPIEIHLGGNLADTIDRLETVSEYVQKAVIITDEQQEREIVDRLKVKRSRLLDKLVIITADDVFKAVEATNVLKSFTAKLFGD